MSGANNHAVSRLVHPFLIFLCCMHQCLANLHAQAGGPRLWVQDVSVMFSHIETKALLMPWYEMPPMPTSQAMHPALPSIPFSDAWTW